MEYTENLRRKSSDELKKYLTDEGYKDEAVASAVNILRERGVNIDAELRARQVAYCSVCKKRNFSSEAGLICSLSGGKATFISACENFDKDEEAAANKEEINSSSKDWGGFMHFYWFVLVCGAALTLFGNFFTFNLSDYSNSFMLAASDAVLLLSYSALCIYTLIAFVKRLPNAVALGKLQNYLLIAMNTFNLISSGFESDSVLFSSSRLLGSVIWAVIFLVYLYTNEQVNAIIPKESRHMLKYDKPIIWSLSVGFIILFLGGIVSIALNSISSAEDDLKSAVNSYQSSLPIRSESSEIRNAYISDNTLYIDNYAFGYSNDDLTSATMVYYPIFAKELLMFSADLTSDSLVQKCWAADYGYCAKWFDINGDYTYELNFTVNDLNEMFDTVSHKTSATTMAAFVEGWNRQCPVQYVGGTMYERAEMSPESAIVYLTIQDADYEDLEHLTYSYLKEYLKNHWEYVSDNFTSLAALNEIELTYKFCASCSKHWSEEVTFTPAEYLNF